MAQEAGGFCGAPRSQVLREMGSVTFGALIVDVSARPCVGVPTSGVLLRTCSSECGKKTLISARVNAVIHRMPEWPRVSRLSVVPSGPCGVRTWPCKQRAHH